MPFFKTHEVPKEFFKLFLKHTTKKNISLDNREHPMLPIPIYGGDATDFMVRYYRRSGESSVEDVREFYPCIVMQDFQPEIRKEELWGKGYIEGYISKHNGREVIDLPIPMEYKFQVSVVTRRLKEVHSANDWFLQNFTFQRPDCFNMNIVPSDDGDIFDSVPYRVTMNEVPRDDGRFEYVYNFSLDTYIHPNYKEYSLDGDLNVTGGNFKDMVEKLTLKLSTQGYKQLEIFINHNF